jgi:EpsI family protein
MVGKSFIAFLSVVILTFLSGFAIRHYQPETSTGASIGDFPLQKDGWSGQKDNLIPAIVAMLNPTEIFSATYTDAVGNKVHLFFDYFAQRNARGGPHSPRNCLPGSGWTIRGVEKREIILKGRSITIGRFDLRMGESKRVMDFWYITRYGETANDYTFKIYTLISSLTFKPNDIAFIRIMGVGDEAGLSALDDFEKSFAEEIYNHLRFD